LADGYQNINKEFKAMAEKNNFFREEAIKDTFFKPGTDGKQPQLMSIAEINQSSVNIVFEATEEEQKE